MRFPSFFPRLFHPAVYQGKKHAKNYFEGWYYKHVDQAGKEIWSVIFGVSHSSDPHSFIQVIQGANSKTDYIRFPMSDFSYNTNQLEICIGRNRITENSIELDLAGENFTIQGKIEYAGNQPFPQKLLAPGIMGWYTYAPFMECYHGVVSMHHKLEGSLSINDREIDFTGGTGYIEKDWGKSMPSDWIWIQCNHFDQPGEISMMISVARIPWLSGHFPGFLSFVYLHGKVYRFATYNRSAIRAIELKDDSVQLLLENRKYRLSVQVERKVSGQLQAPVEGVMDRKIAESLDAGMQMVLQDRKGNILFSGKGMHAGLEIVGDVTQYIR